MLPIVVVVFVVTALPVVPLPAGVLRQLEDSLGSSDRSAHATVRATNATGHDRRCSIKALVVVAVDADVVDGRSHGQANLAARALGKDARGRACQQDVVVEVRWRYRVSPWSPGTALPVHLLSGGLALETDGIVVPCPAADRDAGLVCARTSQGKTIKGAIADGALLVRL